jgi:hypothetical protein
VQEHYIGPVAEHAIVQPIVHHSPSSDSMRASLT